MTRDVGDDPMTAIPWPSACVFQPETPPGYSRFVANKRQSAIRPDGHRAVEALLSLTLAFEFG
jgi:hypothetical protein